MALTIEDGTRVAGANSFATVAEARAYATERGLTLPATDPAVEQLLIRACDYLQSLEDRYKGARVDSTQALAWPRQAVYMFGDLEPLADTAIPSYLKAAQCQLAVDLNTTELMPLGASREVLSETVGPLSTTYARSGVTAQQPQPAKALSLLQPLMRTSGLRTIRV